MCLLKGYTVGLFDELKGYTVGPFDELRDYNVGVFDATGERGWRIKGLSGGWRIKGLYCVFLTN